MTGNPFVNWRRNTDHCSFVTTVTWQLMLNTATLAMSKSHHIRVDVVTASEGFAIVLV
jgi:hypothetical protein